MKESIKKGVLRVLALLLFIVILPIALILVLILTVIAFIYMIVETIINKDKRNIGNIIDGLTHYFKSIDLSIDQTGNVTFANLLNAHFLDVNDKESHLFGDPDETISEVTGINHLKGKLTRTWLQKGLYFVEKDHSKDAFLSSYDKSVAKVNKYKELYNTFK